MGEKEKDSMKETLIGSSFEMSLRILLMLDVAPDVGLDETQIAAIDFISVYAADFGLLDENLHGYGNYRFGEYPYRRELVTEALRELTLSRYVMLCADEDGFKFFITEDGRGVCGKLSDSYAEEYVIAVNSVMETFDINDSKAMIRTINTHAMRSLEGTTHG